MDNIKRYNFTINDDKKVLQEVKRRFGAEAMIESITQIEARTPTTEPLFEVIVAIEENKYQAYLEELANAPIISDDDEEMYNYLQDDVVELSSKKSKISKDKFSEFDFSVSQTPYEPKKPLVAEKNTTNYDKVNNKLSSIKNTISNKYIDGISSKTIYEMQKEIKQLTDKIATLASMQWEERLPLRDNLVIPPEFASIYKKAKQSGMLKEHLDSIMIATLENMPSSMKSSQSTVERYFNALLRRMLPCRIDDENLKQQKIMMLVGPTGVGKTTTLAKLAFRYAHTKKLKTGIITLDTYRLGAVEQLRQYANMMRLPMIDALEASDFDRALKGLSTCDVILVDTIGGSQYDYKKLEKIYNITNSTNANLDINLVLNASSKYEDLLDTYKAFSFLNLDTIIITKFDETKVFGNVFSLVYETGKPISFFSIGQEVPDDLMEADSKFLVDCLLDGFYKVKG